MRPKNEGILFSKSCPKDSKNPNPRLEVTSVVIHIYFLAFHELCFTLAYLLFCILIALEKNKKLLYYISSLLHIKKIIIRSFITAFHYCIIKILKPHVNKSMMCKNSWEYSPWWHKIYIYTMHAYFLYALKK
jgi:hypothetical protein